MNVQALVREVHTLRGVYSQKQKALDDARADLEMASARVRDTEEARTFISTVAQKTQENLHETLSSIVTSALESVFGDSYKFTIRYVQRRNATECDLILSDQDDNEMDPLGSAAGGVVDIVSLALRVAVWSLSGTAPVLVLDEPFRNLHGAEMRRAASLMINNLAHKIGVQIIMVSDVEETFDGADRLIYLERGTITHVE